MSNKTYTKQPNFNLDLKKKYTAIIHTDLGDIKIKLFADLVPTTVNNFVFLARECGDRDVQGLGEPQDGHEQQDGQTLVGRDVVGKHRVHHPRDDGSRDHGEQRLVAVDRKSVV